MRMAFFIAGNEKLFPGLFPGFGLDTPGFRHCWRYRFYSASRECPPPNGGGTRRLMLVPKLVRAPKSPVLPSRFVSLYLRQTVENLPQTPTPVEHPRVDNLPAHTTRVWTAPSG